MSTKKIAILAIMVLAIIAFFAFDVSQYLSLEYIQSQQAELQQYQTANPWMTTLIFFGIYVAVTGLSLPGAAVLTLVAGALFGFLQGLIVVSFASTLGATLAFLASRYLFRDSVQKKFSHQLQGINQGVSKDGAFYLLTLRLVPAVPFFIINIVMGLTTLKTLTFAVVSQIGMLPGTAVFVNAGKQLSQINSLSEIISPAILGSFILLGIFPLITKKLLDMIKNNKIYANWEKPRKFDRNLVVIGAGAGGLVSSYIAAAVKAKVTLIERHKMGGDCLNTGCVPSKALIKTAKLAHQMRHADTYGLQTQTPDFDFSQVMDRVHEVIQKIEPHDSIERYTDLGVECLTGEAKITSPWTVEVNGETLTTRNIVIATGARPFVPPIKGIEEAGYLTSDNLWQIRELPQRLVVLGGGPIGSELTQSFARLGSQVTQVEMLDRLMIREDPDVSDVIKQKFESEGVSVMTSTMAKSCEVRDGQAYLICEREGETIEIPYDQLLVAVGRSANVSGFGLEELNIELSQRRTIQVDEYLRTNYPNIYAVGDVAGPYQFTHTAAHMAWFAAVNSLFGRFKKFKVDYRVIPWATFTDPEVARVGLNETEAKEKGIEYEVTHYGIDDLDRAIADSNDHGFVKVLTIPGKDKILGVTIVGEHAGDLIAEFVTAMKHGLGLNKILGTIHIYPTMAEANKYAAGEWKRAHAPQGILNWLKKFHHWNLS